MLAGDGSERAALTFGQIERRAGMVAARLLAAGGQPGDRAVLMFPPGLEFLAAFFGCARAGIIAVPVMPPRRLARRDHSAAIMRDCAPRFLLTAERLGSGERFGEMPPVERLAITANDSPAAPCLTPPAPVIAADDVAFLQYTSGSTGEPKGIEVTHGSLLANLEMIRRRLGNAPESTHVSWLPLYHDMGLILNVLQAFYAGALCVLLAPAEFMQRPLTWLRAISAYRAQVAGGPNFGYELCVSRYRPELLRGVDLSCWKVAVNGAEPVRADTIERFCATYAPHGFDPAAMHPAYGMAEATLLISAGACGEGVTTRAVSRSALQRNRIAPPAHEPAHEDDRQLLVACGRALTAEQLAIVSPETGAMLDADEIGEIWVSGGNVCRSYWRNPVATAEAFGARSANRLGREWLRTGDLGFLDAAGRLFITGRIKDVIIIRGANHYPQDIERTAEMSHPALRPHCGAAFSNADTEGEERLIIVHEVVHPPKSLAEVGDIVGAIREAVAEEHELGVHQVTLLRRGTIPKTTSGKIQRRLTRELWLAGALAVADVAAPPEAQP